MHVDECRSLQSSDMPDRSGAGVIGSYRQSDIAAKK